MQKSASKEQVKNSMTQENKNNSSHVQGFPSMFKDNRSETIAQLKLQSMANSFVENKSSSSDVVQRIIFNPGQDGQVMNWITDNGLWNVHPFQGLCTQWHNFNSLDNNDPDAIAMLFLTMVNSYRTYNERNVIIDYLYNVYDLGVILPATVSEFTHRYKTFYHLYRRARLAHSQTPVVDAHNGMIGLTQALGNQPQGAHDTAGPAVATDVDRIQKITTAANGNHLTFPSQSSAVSHLVKHGSMYNFYNKITGTEGAAQLGLMIDNYVQDANYAIRNGVEDPGRRDITLGRNVYVFTTDYETAIVSIAPDGSNVFIATYFWTEPPNYVNDVVPGNGQDPNH